MFLQGIVPVSTVDWPGKITTVVFFAGCNLRCPFCQNPDGVATGSDVDVATVRAEIEEGRKYIDVVGFSGGEPTLQPDELAQLTEFARSLGLKTMMETNGTRPDAVASVLPRLDFVAIDVKAPLSNPSLYASACGLGEERGSELVLAVSKSLDILKSSGNDFEVRTTIVPGITDSEPVISAMAKDLGRVRWRIAQFRNTRTLDPKMQLLDPPGVERMHALAAVAKSHGADVRVWTLERGEEGGQKN